MMGLVGALALCAVADVGPTVAVLPLEAKTGVEPSTADVVSDNLLDQMRRSHAFSRVVSAKEIEALMGLEQKKQLLSCSSESCMAELAGALGVDFLMQGSLARLGATFVFNAKLLNVRTGVAASSVSHRLKGTSEETLLDGVGPAVVQLIREAGLKPGPVTHTASGADAPGAAAGQEANAASGGHLGMKVGGGALLGAAVLMGVLGPVLVGLAVGLQAIPRLVSPPPLGVPYELRAVGLYGATGVGGGLGVLLLAGALASAGTAVAVLVSSFLMD